MSDLLPAAEMVAIGSLVRSSPDGVARRVIAKNAGGAVTLFAFSAGQQIASHTAPVDVLLTVIDGALRVTVGGVPLDVPAGSLVRLPAGVPHALDALAESHAILVVLRETPVA